VRVILVGHQLEPDGPFPAAVNGFERAGPPTGERFDLSVRARDSNGWGRGAADEAGGEQAGHESRPEKEGCSSHA